MLKEIKIKNIQKINIMGEYGSNKPILHIDGEIYRLEEEEEYIELLGSKNVKIVYEVEDEILDEQEKKYLSNLVRPFRDKVLSIIKTEYYNEREEFVSIILRDDVNIDLPNFKKGTMYKGMETNKDYTLKELGL